MKKQIIASILLLASSAIAVQAQSVGSIAIFGFKTEGTEAFSFVALTSLSSGTVIRFTDNAFTGSALATNEGTLTYTAPSTIAAGTVITILGSGNFGLSNSGDSIIAYTGTSTYLHAVSDIDFITSGSTTSSTSYVPTGLANGTSAVDFGTTTPPYFLYTGIKTGTAAELFSAINVESNWTTYTNETTYNSTLATTTFTVVPEPHQYGIAIAGLLGVVVFIRRRQKAQMA